MEEEKEEFIPTIGNQDENETKFLHYITLDAITWICDAFEIVSKNKKFIKKHPKFLEFYIPRKEEWEKFCNEFFK